MSSIRRFLRVAPLLCTLGLFSPAVRADTGYSIKATRTSEKITIDGVMDEPAWQTAPLITDWYQTRNQNVRAREQTEVRILYDADNLYFGFHCLDSHPDQVKAYTVQNEGFLHGEDNITVIIDTFLDHRNAYYFWTNLLGVRTDGRIVDDGEAFSTDWQGEWESKGSLVADGWVVEVRIPFRNFQFEKKPEQTFGLLLDREQVSQQEWSNWTPDGYNSAKVSRYPHLTGLEGINPRPLVTVTPYVGGQLQLPSSQLPGALPLPQKQVSPDGSFGLDAHLDPSPSTSLKLALNPDFSEFDTDPEVLYLDTVQRYIPERRQFFLESEGLFVSPHQIFYSRNIAPHFTDHIWAGGQAVGKVGGFNFAALDTQSSELRADGVTYEQVNSGAVRLQQDVGSRSHASFTGVQRVGDTRNTVLNFDTNIHLFEEFFSQVQLARSFSDSHNDQAWAFHGGIHRFDTLSEVWLWYEDVGKNFNDTLGYIPILDKRALAGHINYDWFTKSDWLPRLQFTYDGGARENHAGDLTRHRHNLSLQPFLTSSFALTFGGLYDQQLQPSVFDATKNVRFTDWTGTAGFIIKPNEWQSFNASAFTGTFLGADILGFSSSLNLKAGPHVVLKLSSFYTRFANLPLDSPIHLSLRRDDGFVFGWYAQARYHFTPDLYTRVTVQGGRVVGVPDLGQNEGHVIDAIFGWHYRPGSDLFVVYTDQPYLGQQQRRLLAKVSFEY